MTHTENTASGHTPDPQAANEPDRGTAVELLDDESIAALYEHVRHIARRIISKGFDSDSLATTDVSHEAFAKILGDMGEVRFESERHLLNTAATVMRRLLIDRLRRRTLRKPALDELARQMRTLGKHGLAKVESERAFTEQLDQLQERRPRAAEVMRFRVYFQMTLQEIADTLGCSVTAVHREVAFARAFLLQTSR
jgi:RNA polymerase sigma factor (TIGR02999 family)